jgi:N-acetylmuramoyl-L-alanine amidase
MKVYISPSTQEHNAGAIPGYIEETEMNLIADILIPELERHGITTYRNKPEMTLQEVVKDSDYKGVDLHLAIHSNAGGTNARGVVVCVSGLGYNAEKFAKMIVAKFKPLQPFDNRASNILVTPKLYEVKNTKAPAVIVEVDFHDNEAGARWIQSHRKEIANALLMATLEYFNIKYRTNDTITFDELKLMLEEKGISSIVI